MNRLARTAWLPVLLALACQEGNTNGLDPDGSLARDGEATDLGAPDANPNDAAPRDAAERDAEPSDGGEALCYRGWSSNPSCCLSSDTLASVGGVCPTGYFSAAQCGRLDPICESVDAGPQDGGPPELDCREDSPLFLGLDRSCTEASDCEAGTRQYNCCGSLLITGINRSEAAAFADAAAQCALQFPQCGCPSEPTRADDGTTMDPGLGADAIVECVDDVCRTTFPQAPQACGPNLSCDPAREICVATSPVGPSIQYACQPVPVGCERSRACACV